MDTKHRFTYLNKGIEKSIELNTSYIDLGIEEILNMMRQYLLMLGYSDDTARGLRIVEPDDDAQIYEHR